MKQSDGDALKYADKSLKADRRIMLAAVKQNGLSVSSLQRDLFEPISSTKSKFEFVDNNFTSPVQLHCCMVRQYYSDTHKVFFLL